MISAGGWVGEGGGIERRMGWMGLHITAYVEDGWFIEDVYEMGELVLLKVRLVGGTEASMKWSISLWQRH